MTTARQFETLLRVRRHRRDQVRLVLARILAEGREIDEAADRVRAEREDAVGMLRSGTAAGGVDIDRAASLRYHAGRLSVELAGLAQAAVANAERVRQARSVLAKADQAVRAAERLRDRWEENRRREAERRADREATDRFAAVRPFGGPLGSDP
ncbi:MAG TPA: hypothetical protein VF170_05500 [Planctomycetaceae bacterium]